jgi:acyl-CoA synthetase (AMP-forming)/AMP-acid ligase II
MECSGDHRGRQCPQLRTPVTERRDAGWRTVPELLAACVRHRADVTLLADSDGRAVTGAELLDRALRGAHHLRGLGVRHGQFVAVDGSMSWIDVASSYFSVTWLGAVAVLVMDVAAARDASAQLGVGALITSAGGREQALDLISLADLQAATPEALPAAAAPEDLLDVVYTSGTTGSPKPVVSTHEQWAAAIRPEILASRARRTVGHTGIPIVVSGGLHAILLNHVARGVTSLWGRTAPDLVEACRPGGVSELHLTPHAGRGLVQLVAPDEPWAARVRIVRIVGGPVPAALATSLGARFPGARVVSLYGLTEGGAALCAKVVDAGLQDSIGRPLRGTEVRVWDADGHEVPDGEVGEVVIRTAGAAPLAYYEEESLNRTWFQGGWARTGDLGYVAADGEVRLVGRAKELIFLKGGRVSPETVEEILARVIPPQVEFTVMGVSSEGAWDRIAVFLQGRPEAPEIAAAARELARMRGPFRPELVRTVAAIPRGTSGKPLRRLLARGLDQAP